MGTFTYESVRNKVKGLTLSGTTTFSGAVNFGADDTGYDITMYGDTASRYWMWDTSADGVVQRGTLTVGVDDTGHDVKLFGATSGRYWLWDESANGVVQIGTLTVGVDDTGHDVVFYGATASKYFHWDESTDSLVLPDSTYIKLGTSQDMTLYHDGTNSYITNGTGDLTVDATNDINLDADGGDVVLKDGGTQYGTLTNTSGNLIIKSGSTTAATFSGANVTLAGTVGSGAITSTAGLAGTTLVMSSTGSFGGNLTVTGSITASADVTAYSDMNLKSDIKTIPNALDKVSDLRGVYYTKDGEAGTGVIAQEVENILPEVVKDGEYKSVAYGNMVGILIEAIKELKKEVEVLKEAK